MSKKSSNLKLVNNPPRSHSGGMSKGDVALTRLAHVRSELAKLYREARRGQVDVADASRLANMLQILARIMSDSELERRIEALEQKRELS